MSKKIIFTQEQIKDICYKYRFLNMKQEDIAVQYNVGRHTITKRLRENNCIRAYKDKEWLEEQYYVNKKNKREIAKLANCNESSIGESFKKFNIVTDDRISRRRKYEYNETFFDIIDSPEKAYWLGFIIADGHISNKKDKTSEKRLQINLAKVDFDHLKKLANCLCPNIKIREITVYLKATGKHYEQCEVKFYNKHIVESLIKLGIKENKSLKEIYPNIPKELDKHFIRGEFDGDGCFYSKQAQLTFIGSKQLVASIRDKILYHLNIGVNVRVCKKLHVITYNRKNAVKIMKWLYSDGGPYLDRKYNKFNKYLSDKI